MSMEELKEFIKEAEVEENLLSTSPISEIDIQAMSEDQLKDFVMEAVIETKLLEPIVIPIREAQLVQMSKYGEKKFSQSIFLARFSTVSLQGGTEGADYGDTRVD